MDYKRPAFAALSIVLLVGCATSRTIPEGTDGTWKARRPGGGDRVRIDLRYRGDSGVLNAREYLALGSIAGLDEEAFHSSAEPLYAELERGAGKFILTGKRARRPHGTFVFEPSAEFRAILARLGAVSTADGELLRLALTYLPLEYAREIAEIGWPDLGADGLYRLRTYGVSASYVEAMRRLDNPPDADDLIRLHINGVPAGDV